MPAMLDRSQGGCETAPAAQILVVEDERIVALHLRQTLARLGYEVTATVASGVQALQEIGKKNPDLILMDIHLDGDIDGIETARSIPPELRIPVIYLTAYAEEATLERARDTHPYGYLLKPFSDRELHATIQMVLERRKVDLALRKSEERLSLALDSAEMGSWELDAASRTVVHMGRADRIFGGGQDVFTGTWDALLDQVHDEDRPLLDAMFEHLSADDAAGEVEFRRPDQGGVRWIKARGKLFPADGGTRVIGVMQDVTEHREKAEELRRTTAELLAQQERLRAALDAASRASRAKSDFLAVMSHELRTPMNAILGFGQLLDRKTFGQLTPRQHEYVGHILEAGGHLLHLIDDLLDLGKIEAAKLEVTIERVELAPLLERVAASLAPLAAQHQIELTTEIADGLAAAADGTRLSQALINLGSNAIKYNRPGGLVRISAALRAEGWVRITVADSGVGIPARRQRELFEPFNRLGAERGTVEGTGIGLPISKRLVELMGGHLGFESALGAGSKFWIDLPIHRPSPAAPAMEASETVPPLRDGGLVVLYIDDRLENFRLMRNIIESMAGGRLIEATSVALGFELAQAYRPDLILLDLDAPTLDSEAMLQQLHGSPQTAAIPLAVLSAATTPGTASRALPAGVALALAKPLRVHELFRIIGPIAQRRQVAFLAQTDPRGSAGA